MATELSSKREAFASIETVDDLKASLGTVGNKLRDGMVIVQDPKSKHYVMTFGSQELAKDVAAQIGINTSVIPAKKGEDLKEDTIMSVPNRQPTTVKRTSITTGYDKTQRKTIPSRTRKLPDEKVVFSDYRLGVSQDSAPDAKLFAEAFGVKVLPPSDKALEAVHDMTMAANRIGRS